MKNSAKINEWNHVFLDTSFIIDYLSDPGKFAENPHKKENIEMSKKVMEALSSEKRKEKPVFYVTSITIGELRKLESSSIVKKIVEIFSAGNVVIVSYRKEEAIALNDMIDQYRKAKAPKASLRDLERARKESGCINFRSWINDDMKILSCAKILYDRKQLDVILTSDEKTFLPIAEFLKLPCRISNGKYFPPDLFESKYKVI
jgi:ribosomal protein L20